ncbi:MAG TPA: DNA-binding protein WhiA [Candidatus Fournierella excrementavium]|uniref:DNA-binding protein WhiA n=1 Tax=Allofournierella TaxID=1940255 RepID=UPI001F9103B4|nr:DNA-binding protein WhiA [Fournierella sp.]MEE0756760.1 DNA-binding protein WhiA [Fournierella sp.]HJD17944.1 DNA-binding protein WhiA [Candidatus Fournierella excrementavium]
MSFSQDVKNEIVQKKITRECCALAASYGIACFGRYFDSKGLVLHTELLGVAQYAKRLFGICGVHGAIITKERPSGPLYEFKVDDPQEVDKMLKLFHCEEEQVSRHIDPRLIRCGHCFSAFVASAFLCCGTMTDPSKEYNLEFLCPRYNLAKDLEGILAEHEFTPRRTVRKGVNVIYVKASEQVADLLTFMGAGGAAMQIMDHKMFKELRNKTNRLNNCEMANIDKVVTANVAARKAIEYLQQKGDFDALPAPLRQAAQLRLDWPDLSLAQLVQKSPEPISKSGLSHRLKKLEQLADELRQRRNDV